MELATLPIDEPERLAALHSYVVLDSAAERAFDEIAALAARLLGMPIGVISLVDANRQWFKARQGIDVMETPRDISFCSHAILGSEPLVVPDARADPRFADNPMVVGAPHVRFYAGAPLINPEGHALGALCVVDRVPHELSPESRDILQTLARAAMTALELRRATQRGRDMALSDVSTGLPNRRALLEGLDRALARMERLGDPVPLFCLQIDGLKALSEAQGHLRVEQAVQEAAAALRAAVRREDMPARISDNAFAVLLSGCAADAMPHVGERVRAALQARMDQHCVPVAVSAGGARFRMAPRTAAQALELAEQAMYAAGSVTGTHVTVREH